jgi:hypothetical protein
VNRWIAFVSFCLVLGVSVYLLSVRLHSTPVLLDFLPVETLAVVEGRNGAQTLAGWHQSVVADVVRRFDVLAVLEQHDKRGQGRLPWQMTFALLAGREKIPPPLLQLLAHEGLVAFLPPTFADLPRPHAVLDRLVMILHIDNGTPAEAWLIDWLGPLRTRTTQEYQGQPLITLEFASGRSVVYCRYRGVLLAATNREPIERCINQYRQRMVQVQTGMQLNHPYQRLKRLAGGELDVFFYADLKALSSWLPFPVKAEHQALLPQHLAVYQQSGPKQQRLGTVALVDQGRSVPLTTFHPPTRPMPDPLQDTLSAETCFSFWTNWLNPQTFWEWGLRAEIPELSGLMTMFAQHLEAATGHTLAAFFNALGSELGVFIDQQRAPRQTPRTMACVALAIHDQNLVRTLVSQLLAGMQAVTVVTKGVEIVSVVLAGGLLQPAYAVLPHQLIVADSVELIERLPVQQRGVLTSGKPGPSGEGERTGNFFLFVQTGMLAERLLPFVTTLRKENRELFNTLSLKNGQLVHQVAVAVLTGLKDVAHSRVRGFAFGDELLLEMEYTLR